LHAFSSDMSATKWSQAHELGGEDSLESQVSGPDKKGGNGRSHADRGQLGNLARERRKGGGHLADNYLAMIRRGTGGREVKQSEGARSLRRLSAGRERKDRVRHQLLTQAELARIP